MVLLFNPFALLIIGVGFLFHWTALGEGLRGLSDERKLMLGVFVQDQSLLSNPSYEDILTREFNTSIFMADIGFLYQSEAAINFAHLDRAIAAAKKAGHKATINALAWYPEFFENPMWFAKYSTNPEKLSSILEHYIKSVIGHVRDKFGEENILAIGPVNEPLETYGYRLRTHLWSGIHPEDPLGYMVDAFRWAHEAAPNAKLFINEIFTERSSHKFDALIDLVEKLRARGAQVHAIGMQMHQFMPSLSKLPIDPKKGKMMVVAAPPRRIEENVRKIQSMGIDVYFSEIDMAIRLPKNTENSFSIKRQLQAQARFMFDIASICVRYPACKNLSFWGVTDKESWINDYVPDFGKPLLFDEFLMPKPAYSAFARALSQ